MTLPAVAVLGFLAGIVWLAFALERRFAWARAAGACLLAIFFGAVASNVGLLPAASGAYDLVSGPLTSFAIVWLLLAVDLRNLARAGRPMLLAFAAACVATATGAVAAALLLHGALGDDTWRVIGTLTGTYTGGSLNFVSVARAVELPESIFSGLAAADNLMTSVWMGCTLVLPAALRPWFARRLRTPAATEPAPEQVLAPSWTSSLEIGDVAALVALAAALTWLSELVGAQTSVPSVLWLTTFALVAGRVPRIRALQGAFPLGVLALHLFFAVIGALSRVDAIAATGLWVLAATAVVVGVHGLLVYLAAWLLRIDAETASEASQAAIGGAATALALAVAMGWDRLAFPGMAVGLAGYAVGTYLGVALAETLRALL